MSELSHSGNCTGGNARSNQGSAGELARLRTAVSSAIAGRKHHSLAGHGVQVGADGIEDRLFFAVGTLDRWSDGLSSYAVANAHHTVLDAIDQVIATNDEDGVAQVVERLFPARAAR